MSLALYELPADRRQPRRLTTRYLGATSAVSRDDLLRSAGTPPQHRGHADLYALDRSTGRVRALTSEARLLDDLSPDGTTLAAVKDLPDRRESLVRTPARAGDNRDPRLRTRHPCSTRRAGRQTAGPLPLSDTSRARCRQALVDLDTRAVRTVTPAVHASSPRPGNRAAAPLPPPIWKRSVQPTRRRSPNRRRRCCAR